MILESIWTVSPALGIGARRCDIVTNIHLGLIYIDIDFACDTPVIKFVQLGVEVSFYILKLIINYMEGGITCVKIHCAGQV